MTKSIQTMAGVAMAIVAVALLLGGVVSAQRKETPDILLPSQVGTGKPPCCDACICTKSMPPKCQCQDSNLFGCHEDCDNCVQLPILIWPPRFVCNDWFVGYCGSPCDTA